MITERSIDKKSLCLQFHYNIHTRVRESRFVNSFLRYIYRRFKSRASAHEKKKGHPVSRERPSDCRPRLLFSKPFPLTSLSALLLSIGFACLAGVALALLGSCISLLFLRSSTFSFCVVEVRLDGA